jgi:hypothetical protein
VLQRDWARERARERDGWRGLVRERRDARLRLWDVTGVRGDRSCLCCTVAGDKRRASKAVPLGYGEARGAGRGVGARWEQEQEASGRAEHARAKPAGARQQAGQQPEQQQQQHRTLRVPALHTPPRGASADDPPRPPPRRLLLAGPHHRARWLEAGHAAELERRLRRKMPGTEARGRTEVHAPALRPRRKSHAPGLGPSGVSPSFEPALAAPHTHDRLIPPPLRRSTLSQQRQAAPPGAEERRMTAAHVASLRSPHAAVAPLSAWEHALVQHAQGQDAAEHGTAPDAPPHTSHGAALDRAAERERGHRAAKRARL